MPQTNPKSAVTGVFDRVYQTMVSFEDTKRIDPTKLGVFDEAIEELDQYSKRWVGTRKIDTASALDAYLACSLSREALVGVRKRLEEGIVKMENPTSVHETIEIIELVREIGSKLETSTKNLDAPPRMISRSEIQEIAKLTGKLDERGIAQHLIPTPKQSLKNLPKEKVSRFMESVARKAIPCR